MKIKFNQCVITDSGIYKKGDIAEFPADIGKSYVQAGFSDLVDETESVIEPATEPTTEPVTEVVAQSTPKKKGKANVNS